jgi:hypothetical protein
MAWSWIISQIANEGTVDLDGIDRNRFISDIDE